MKAKISQSVNLVSLNYATSGKCVEFHASLKFMIGAHSTFPALIKDEGMQTPFLKFSFIIARRTFRLDLLFAFPGKSAHNTNP